MTTAEIRKDINHLLAQVPEGELTIVQRFLQAFVTEHFDRMHPAIRATLSAPEDDEPLSDEDRQALEEAYADVEAGRMIPHEDVRKRVFGK